ncbi:G1/S-specific cyclin-E protein [Quillaja saponaria]|uniref:G1/S-specific cyclin-E protein n=1 Tax=Quillaja saponaria TaxID=32244 RepID=A0AAD7PS12_QUISA|nr:G1/S-specific cyclin-E protein [Quillaja saponaria]
MGKGDNGRCIFPLTSLQIGDLQSYHSDLSLFLGNDSKKMYILVDNRPWLRDLGSRRAHLWQLMVTKSRLSPFANTKSQRERKEGKDVCAAPSTSRPKKFTRWFSLIYASTLSQKRVLLPVKKLRNSLLLCSELHRTLYGIIVFEVSWTNVRGISYLNELQTDTSLAIEAKSMQRWEFDSIAQAASRISSWFSGTVPEQCLLKEYLDSAMGELFFDANEDFLGTIPIDDEENNCCNNLSDEDSPVHGLGSNFGVYSSNIEEGTTTPHTPPPPTGPYKRRKIMKWLSNGVEVDDYSEEMQSEIDDSLEYNETFASENEVEATQYMDVLMLFRFDDGDLPFKFKEVIMADLRLLTLLEAGLPSWVIFLQSYPGFCHLYRPWMCLLARALYVLISVVTVLIGFYDLYKNVPVLKATASRVCGPLFDWIETWEMVSRIKYLGTMLFLHNCQKAVKWFLTITHTTKSFFSFLAQPLPEPLVELFGFLRPVCNVFTDLVQTFSSTIWIVIEFSCNLVGDLVEILFFPLWFVLTVTWSIATSVLYPVFWIFREVLYAPLRLALAASSFVAFVCTLICNILGDAWQFVSSIFQLASASGTTVSSYEVSMWRSLWSDLFSQVVFRAVRSILNGFVAFFAACNRHRLSIYNHIQEFIRRLFGDHWRLQHADSRDGRSLHGTRNMKERGKMVSNKVSAFCKLR